MNFRQRIGARLLEVRHARKVTQTSAARAAGRSQSSISYYEQGRREFNVVDLLAILDDMKVSLADYKGVMNRYHGVAVTRSVVST